MFKERPLDTLFSRDLLQMLLLLALWAHASSTVFKVRQRSKNCKLSLLSRFFSTVFWSFETNKNGDIVTLSLQFSLKCSIFNFPFIKRKSRALLVDFARVLCGSRCGPCALLQLIRITRLSLFSRHMIGSAQCYSYCHWPIVLSVKTLTKDCNRRYIRHVSYFYDRKVISL